MKKPKPPNPYPHRRPRKPKPPTPPSKSLNPLSHQKPNPPPPTPTSLKKPRINYTFRPLCLHRIAMDSLYFNNYSHNSLFGKLITH
ncbi:hypothetical protein HanPSC8_Chr07g0295181 [Helianthus annuus]|nr:hypothetical protein HanPSC8_Chr07g0295181 [Helianthus annuus]